MKVGVIQLSDIHIQDSTNPILNRGREIVASVLGAIPTDDAYLLALTGDLAFSGRADQYLLVSKFIDSIRQQFIESARSLFVAMVPGNHDLDFQAEPDTRPLLLASLRDKIGTLDPHGETVRQLVSTQSAYFDFEASILNSPMRSPGEYLSRSQSFAIGGNVLRINSYNTAWVSTNPEKPGQLLFPVASASLPHQSADLTISMFHHPYNWLSPENARVFRHAIEASSDIVLTGHEHEAEIYEKVFAETGAIQYVEGAVLQDGSSQRSGFNALSIDTDGGTYETFVCDWQKDSYVATQLGSHKFVRNRVVSKSYCRISESFLATLNDPALPILHPRKRDIGLDDLFIYPTISYRTLDKPTVLPKMVYSGHVVEHMRQASYVLLLGDDTIGKTSLAKKLFRDLHSDGTLIPILLAGTDFQGFSDKDLRKAIRAAAVDQYDEDASQRYFGLEQSQRVVIVDNWQDIRYTARGRSQIIRYLKSFFGKVICLTNRLQAFDEIVEPGSTKTAFADFEFGEIKPFGKHLTGKLIEKWHALEREHSADDIAEFHYAVAASEHKIRTVLGKGLLPAYPVFIIGLLQADTSPNVSSQNVGSYGHVLEALITARLTEVSSRSTDIGLLYTYLSRVAYFLFKEDRSFLSSRELSTLHSDYCLRYKMKLNEAAVAQDLTNSKLLVKDGDSYKFRYRGSYCYFVARYFAEQMADGPPFLRAELNDITDKLVYDDFTCIVMFYLYLTRDAVLIERLLANAGAIYADCEPSKLEEDVTFVNKLLNDKPEKLVLPSTDIAANRERFRLQEDEAEGRVPENEYRAPEQRVAYADGLDEILKIGIALQSLRVMGQVLRNFPGVLTAEPKYRLTEASYLLGLRTLARFLKLADTQREGLRVLFAQVFKDRHPLATEEELAKSGDQGLIWLAGAASYGIIKRVCNSVGLKDLELTFEDVKAKYNDRTSIRLIHLAIKLEHFRGAPEAEIYEIERSLGKNYFAYKLLRDLVAEYLLLHNTDTKVFQRLGTQFEIKTSDPRFLLNKIVKS